MRKTSLCRTLGWLSLCCTCYVPAYAIDEDGTYFTQDFEDLTTYPLTKSDTVARYVVEGQGEWLYLGSFSATNTSYIVDGSEHDLRMPKKGSYVITPLLSAGVERLTFDLGRASVKVYTSSDSGETWSEATQSTSSSRVTVTVKSSSVNRIKIANDASKDADIDNLTVYAAGFEAPKDTTASDPTVIVTPSEPTVISSDTIWCSPDGDDTTADGSEEHPFYDLQKAIDIAHAGSHIWMKAGTYVYDKRINIDDCNGTANHPIELFGYEGRAVLDFSAMPYHKHSDNPYQGVRLTSSYWHFRHIDITNASDNGLLIERNKPTGGSASDIANRTQDAHDNLIEECNFYKNGDTGLQMKNLASYNRIVNCDSYLNCDEDQGDADGFAPKISVGDGNYFYGCRAYLNSDDGWDVFFKKDGGFGDNMTIILEQCISYKNGFLDENTIAESGNGNGFKCGSNQGAMNVYLNRCLAIHNKAKGFDQNHNAGDIILNNCTGMTLKDLCGDKTYSYRIYETIADGHEVRLTNCVAINDNDATDKRNSDGTVKEGENGKRGLFGRFEVDETLSGLTVTTSEFQKADTSQFVATANDAALIAPRQADGSLPVSTFAHLVPGSFLIDAGTPVPTTTYRDLAVDSIAYNGVAPDLGAYEYVSGSNGGETAIRVVDQVSTVGHLRLISCRNSLMLLTLEGASGTRSCRATLHDASGRLLGRHDFAGQTTAIRLPQGTRGVVLIRVDATDESDHKTIGVLKAVVQ